MNDMTDEELVSSAQTGNINCAEELLKRYKYMVIKCTRPYFIIGAEQDDLIQEGMLGLYRAVLSYKPGVCKFITYAYQCVKSSVLDAVKSASSKKNRWLSSYEEGFGDNQSAYSAEYIAESIESNQELIAAIKGRLSKREYIVFSLFISGNSIADIAELTNVEYKSVENSLQRIRNKIRQLLA